jgi:hypothetical protein
MKIPLNQIIIGVRQRLDLGDLTDLDSMSDPEIRQIQPITVHKTLQGIELIDGRRRLAKAEQLGWKDIDAYEKDQLTPVQKQKVELFADIARKDRTWQEICLSISKIHYMMKSEKIEEGVRWTIRATAQATGYPKTRIACYLDVADALSKEPKDEAVWTADNFDQAYKILLQRSHDLTREEQDRRRALFQQQSQMNLDGTTGNPTINAAQAPGGFDIFAEAASEGPAASPVPNGDTTLPEEPTVPQETMVYIHGRNRPFETESLEKLKQFFLILIPPADPKSGLLEPTMSRIRHALKPGGYLVVWGKRMAIVVDGLIEMPFSLIWNQIQVQESQWPYCQNYQMGAVFTNQETDLINATPQGAVISCMAEPDGALPLSVVDLSLCGPPNSPVLCPFDAPVVQLAELGRIPVWYEPDKAKYDAKVEALKAFYERQIPGCKVEVRG